MVAEIEYGVSGLYTSPNPRQQKPDGALLRADELVIRRPNMAEPRPGFKVGIATSLASIYSILPYRDSALFAGVDGSAVKRIYTSNFSDTPLSGDAEIKTEGSANISTWDADSIRALTARGNCYLTTSDGVRRVTSTHDSVARHAGIPAPHIVTVAATGTNGFLSNGNATAYRVVIKRTDANGLITYSSPSGAFVIANAAGYGVNTVITWAAREVAAGDIMQFYRAAQVASSGTPDDVYFLAFEASVQSGPTRVQTDTDTCNEASLGQALYTNATATEGSATAGHYRAPACTDLALYQGSLFYARVTDYARFTASYLQNDDDDRFGPHPFVGAHSFYGTRANGSGVISGISDVSDLQVGQILFAETDANWSTPQPRITSVGASSVTVQGHWNGSNDGAPVAFRAFDTIAISGVYYLATLARHLVTGVLVGTLGNDGVYGIGTASTTAYAQVIGTIGDAADSSLPVTVSFESIVAGGSFTISASHGDAYTPQIPLHSQTAKTVTAADTSSSIAWSNRDQPEHWKLANIQPVGTGGIPILRALATVDAVWILKDKGDGIYRLSGFGEENGFRVDRFDSSRYLLHPRLACTLGDSVYAWTDIGLVRISDQGVSPISQTPIGVDWNELQQKLDATSGAALPMFMVANAKENEIIIGLPRSDLTSSTTGVTTVLCFNTVTGAFTRWFVGATDIRDCPYNISTRTLMLAKNALAAPRLERLRDETYVINADREFSATISTVVSNVVTLSGAVSGWTPALGDLVRQGTARAVITALSTSTVFTVSDGSVLAAGAATTYEAFAARASWLPKAGPGGSALKRFRALYTHWEDTRGIYSYDVIAAGEVDDTERTKSYTLSYQSSGQKRTDARHLLDAYVSLNAQLYPSVRVCQADARFALAGLTAQYDVATMRVSA